MAEHDQQQALKPCADCGMPCEPGEYHPFAACLMFKACHNSDVVRANLEFVRGSAPSRAAEDVPTDTHRLDWLLPNVHPANFGFDFPGGYEWADDAEYLAKWRIAIDAEIRIDRAAMATDTPAASAAKEA